MPLLLQGLIAVGGSVALTYLIGDDEPTALDGIKSKLTIQNVGAALGIVAAGLTIYKFYKGKK